MPFFIYTLLLVLGVLESFLLKIIGESSAKSTAEVSADFTDLEMPAEAEALLLLIH